MREREGKWFSFSLQSIEIGWSSSDGPRFKDGVLGESYTWIPETPSAWKVWEVESFGLKKCLQNILWSLLTLQEVGFSSTIVILC